MRTRALLVDYGEVISKPQPRHQLAAMAALCGLELPRFLERYWEHRLKYDRGGDASTYWSQVAAPHALDEETLAELMQRDLDSWLELNEPVLEVLSRAQGAGLSLSLLSNAPHDLARKLSADPGFAHFEQLMFSSQLGLVKPEPAVFEAAIARLGRRPAEILFIDDREANVAAALASGLAAVRFESADALRAQVLRLGIVPDQWEGF